jgi:probable F420-dependent oxidoreductase
VRAFRFSTNTYGLTSGADFAGFCRRAEDLGYDTIFAADHLGDAAPFQQVVAAAAATERVRVGTLVINVPFWNVALLAREIATADILTEGRLEVGLGSGHMKWEFDEAGIAWEPYRERAERLAAAIAELSDIFAADGYDQQAALRERFGFAPLTPVQRRGFGGYGPPLIVGGTGKQVLATAAETADIVGIAGARQVTGKPPGVFRLCTAAETDDLVRYTRHSAGDRAGEIEWHILVQVVQLTDDRDAVAAEMARQDGATLTAEEILESPFLLIGTVHEMAEQLVRNRERYGFTYYTVHAPYLDAFAPLIEHVRASGAAAAAAEAAS